MVGLDIRISYWEIPRLSAGMITYRSMSRARKAGISSWSSPPWKVSVPFPRKLFPSTVPCSFLNLSSPFQSCFIPLFDGLYRLADGVKGKPPRSHSLVLGQKYPATQHQTKASPRLCSGCGNANAHILPARLLATQHCLAEFWISASSRQVMLGLYGCMKAKMKSEDTLVFPIAGGPVNYCVRRKGTIKSIRKAFPAAFFQRHIRMP